MRRWLQQRDDAALDLPAFEPEFTTFKETQLRCTPSGQVLQLPGARSVMDLNRELGESFASARKRRWTGADHRAALDEVRRLAGVRPLADLRPAKSRRVGCIEREACRIDKLVLSSEPGIELPALLLQPPKPSGKRYLYLHDAGKAADADPGGAMERLAAAGGVVLAVDLRGFGETAPGGPNMWGGAWSDLFLSYLLGKPMLGMRTEDALAAGRFLSVWQDEQAHPVAEPVKVHLIAHGAARPIALHAAALEPELFHPPATESPYQPWRAVVDDPTIRGQLAGAVHAALQVYDLDDLANSIAPPSR